MSEPFDFDAFIKGTQLARRTVSVYRVDHRDEIERLQEAHDALLPLDEDGEGDEREVPAGDSKKRREIAAQVAKLRDEMESGKTDFVIRTLTPAEFRKVTDNDEVTPMGQFAMQTVDPELTEEQVGILAEHIGSAQWSELMSAANELVLSRVAVPDFSRSVSETLSRHKS